MRNSSSSPEKFRAVKTKPMLFIASWLILCGPLRTLRAVVNSAELFHMTSVDRTPLLLSDSAKDVEREFRKYAYLVDFPWASLTSLIG
jgi:hypothetical protein